MSWIILLFVLIIASVKTRSSKKPMTVSVILPAYNEEKTVASVIKTVQALNYVDEIIVVNDGSLDDTEQVAKEAGATVISHTKNRGKGAAIKTGFKNSKGDVVVFMDADLQKLVPKQVDKMIQPILNDEADVTKTKFKREAGRVTELTAKPLLSFFFPEIKFEQPLSGQFAAKRSFLNNIQLEDDYGVDVGIVLDADVMGVRVKEVDIGNISHSMSSLYELNIVATEVVRTIVDRANSYGRITMIDTLGKSIRMGVLGLSLTTLGFFFVFFIRIRPSYLALYIGLAIVVIGIIIATYYIIKIIRASIKTILRPDDKSRNLKSFFYMHSPLVVSALIMFAVLFTMLGSVHVDEGKISIEPAARNVIFWKQPVENQTIDIRGPYTVDSALENEFSIIRIPQDALNTLELGYGDKIIIGEQSYTLNQTIPGEDSIMRIPYNARTTLGINVRDVIRDTDLRNYFKDLYATKNITLSTSNMTMVEGIIIKNTVSDAKTINIYLNNEKIGTTTGILKDGSYKIYMNGYLYKTIQVNNDNSQKTFTMTKGNNVVRIEVAGDVKSSTELPTSDKGILFYFNFPGS
ncbi:MULTISPECIES: glycosyltransferase [Methanobacterium]|uniref:Dolichyl-phosphate-mannose-protein mannosyltransferase n=1 Tax=Methanobacterium subterraneum TaxID=59277 RepID=A0A2H4VB95_9EURY|nr:MULTISPECIES: glycosyltransferase [Methanobacterium]MBW4256229.1 glycosyltransferase [Methanobacterium sp. YSL]PKL71623.1 MAG: dolichyl-phosphate-mannose-protein mannosyltransferase [Methanobacteriales archaeon HGW-Methanobacteriales-2]AUB55358.1 dolichyl-phosphate-mannose-protein mannosyltransferase [Methanobacterium subterraneum]AUB57665.1 dolichyl-phosphate-mannose-protein mannosyltransferase [Methanobacterium sp. MZ-A1]AUB60798.1 dolichyl-phosphate-mannose-protein mannosyltransferase [M